MISVPVPPASLHAKVAGRAFSDEEFRRQSRSLAEGIDRVLAAHALRMDQFNSVLDFGCGCGRVLVNYAHLAGAVALHGTDIDAAAIAWCRAHIRGIDFSVNGAQPPLAWRDGYFDFAMAISVFTHVPWRMQVDWLRELKRVLRPGGYLLATTHGDCCADMFLKGDSLQTYRDTGYCYIRGIPEGMFPDWYQLTFLNAQYAQRIFGALFEHVIHIPKGLADFQDVVILRRD
jgi:SAM-dependent methyltransferase